MSVKSAKINKTTGNISYIYANIDDVEFNNITPKIIQNNEVFSYSAVNKKATTLKEKTSAYILPGINCIDIDWNKANLSYTVGTTTKVSYVSTTSDLLKIISKINSHITTFNDNKNVNLWEELSEITTTSNLRFEDAANDILTSFTALSLDDISEETIAPYNADHIGVYDENGKKQYNLPLNSEYADLKQEYGFRIYRVGLISDASSMDALNEDNYEYEEANEKLDNALKAFRSLKGVSFISSTGDILVDNLTKEADKYLEYVSSNNIDVYTCKGNTDNAAAHSFSKKTGLVNDIELWKEKMMPSSLYDLHYFKSGDTTSFYFKKPIYVNDKEDVYIYLNVDFDNNRAYPTNHYFNSDTIKELQEILDANSANRCFVFMHYPLSENSEEFVILRKLSEYYTNSIWFSGHTHYQLSAFPSNNVTLNGSYNVHIPSLANPTNAKDEIIDGSEAAIMDVYGEGVNIRGIIFKDDKDNENVYSAFANYWIPLNVTALADIPHKDYNDFV